jgi:glyoxylase-like metal-dependent hydrolase (beta-lactamase superfamily II)
MTSRAIRNEIVFDRTFESRSGELVPLSPQIRRIVAGNAGPMTFTGTCTYVVGAGRVAVIDPGPAEPGHISALLDALRHETITSILVSHTHKDHSPGARLLQQATGAKLYGCPRYVPIHDDQVFGMPLDAAHDLDHAPDVAMYDNDTIEGPGYTLVCVETPGHTATHRAYALPQEQALFSGDHVMAWSTTVVAPPDGKMDAYMRSLEKLRARGDTIFWPGHGGPVKSPQRFVAALAQHRRNREAAITRCLAAQGSTIDTIVKEVYRDLDPRLRMAAALSVLAHLEALVERGTVVADKIPLLGASFRRA